MISPEQVRAARGLLNWTQAELASRSGLSKAAIIKLEQAQVVPRLSSLKFLQETLEDGGIEFTEGDGVRKRGEKFDFRIYDDKYFVDHLDANIERYLKPHELLRGIGGYDKNFGHHTSSGNNERFLLFTLKNKIECRFIAPEGFTDFGSDPIVYRFLPYETIGTIYFTVYGDSLTINNWNPPARALYIRNDSIADAYKRQFDHLWNMAKVPEQKLLRGWREAWREKNKSLLKRTEINAP